MKAAAMLADLSRRGVTVTVDDGMLRLRGSPSALSVELQVEVKNHKSELLAALESQGRDTKHSAENARSRHAGRNDRLSALSALHIAPTVENKSPALAPYWGRITEAISWADLEALLSAAQIAYEDGKLRGEEVEVLAAACGRAARELPEHAGGALARNDDDGLDDFLPELPDLPDSVGQAKE